MSATTTEPPETNPNHTIAIKLVHHVKKYLEQLEAPQLSQFFSEWPQPPYATRTVQPRKLPVLVQLPVLNPFATATSLVNNLIDCAHLLTWGQTYTAEDFGAHFLQHYGWTELFGLRGPINNPCMACGFLLLGADVAYPAHQHQAEEIYVPLNAGSEWLHSNQDWKVHNSATVIHHSPWQIHATRTTSEPLLAIYLWRNGDLTQKSVIV